MLPRAASTRREMLSHRALSGGKPKMIAPKMVYISGEEMTTCHLAQRPCFLPSSVMNALFIAGYSVRVSWGASRDHSSIAP